MLSDGLFNIPVVNMHLSNMLVVQKWQGDKRNPLAGGLGKREDVFVVTALGEVLWLHHSGLKMFFYDCFPSVIQFKSAWPDSFLKQGLGKQGELSVPF